MSALSDFFTNIWDKVQKKQFVLQNKGFWKYLPQLLIALVLIVITVLLFPKESTVQYANLKEGDVYVGEEIIAPFTFYIRKADEEYDKDVKKAAEKVPYVFVLADGVRERSLKELKTFMKDVEDIRTAALSDSTKLRRLQDLLNSNSIIIESENLPVLLSGVQKNSRKTNGSNKTASDAQYLNFENFRTNVIRILTDIYSVGILDITPDQLPDYVNRISVISNGNEIIDDIDNYFNLQDIEQKLLEKLRKSFPNQEVAVKIGHEIIKTFLSPNIFYDESETQKRIQEAVAKVPLYKGTVLAKERIIDTHERITADILERLRSLAQAKAERTLQEGGVKRFAPLLSRIFLIILALSFTAIFLLVSRREIFFNVRKMILILIIFLVVLVSTFLVNQFSLSAYLIPIAIASMLLTIFFDTRMAFIGTVSLSILIGALRGNEFSAMIVPLFVGTMATFSVKEIQARSWILKGILSVCCAYIFSIATIEFFRHASFSTVLNFWSQGLINGVLSPIMAYGLMIIFEYVFRIPTDSTLLELSDLNKPLLRELAFRAPGSYHHSLLVGNLAEAAAKAINANPLLTRVGAYYHDIGKMEKPEYFVENQKGGKNPHEKLAPSMSCLILINHVKRGLEIAEEYNLPKEIRDFIPQHHGNNLISYFYKKALDESEGAEINEADFRYPGPKPQTKETGIVMLADAVEAVSRTLKEPTVSRIRSMVNSIFQERLDGSELDECPLTLRDLNLIKKSFVNILTGIFHGRVSYPGQETKSFSKAGKKNKEKFLETSG